MANVFIREYQLSYEPGDSAIILAVASDYKTNAIFSRLPDEAEANAAFNTEGLLLKINWLFNVCEQMIAAPKLPRRAVLDGILTLQGVFRWCESLIIPPKLPIIESETKSLICAFDGCYKLIQAPVIPVGTTNISYMFRDNYELRTPVSIPQSVKNVTQLYSYSPKVEGELIVRATPTSYNYMFRDTTKQITLYGDMATCETLAATATNNNVAWAPWYDPVPAVTNRGQGSYTTAEDITRMVRNGALAVNTYAPGRMVYHQGDIVRADEWEALVEAAQTIDPTVTYSTHYMNLNKIEKAFDDAL